MSDAPAPCRPRRKPAPEPTYGGRIRFVPLPAGRRDEWEDTLLAMADRAGDTSRKLP